MKEEYDVFICHASEDKETLVTPIVKALKAFGVTAWYDDCELEGGDSISEAIDRGINKSNFALVFITPNFFNKRWPAKYEMRSLIHKEIEYHKKIISILHKVSRAELMNFSPYLAEKKFIKPDLLNPIATALEIIMNIRPDIFKEINKFFGETRQERPISGIKLFVSERQYLGQEWWDEFYNRKKAPKQVLLMAQSISRAFNNPKFAHTFVEWCNNETDFKILFLSPENAELSQLHYIGKGMTRTLSDDPGENLKKKIYESIEDLEENVISKVSDDKKKPQVRYATRDLPFSIAAVDDEMVVTIYGVEAEGDNQPTMIIEGRESEAYSRFKEEFFKIWGNHSKVYPFENPLVTYFKKRWKDDMDKYVALKKFNKNVPPPMQAILFPTDNCNENCSYCLFKEARQSKNIDEMDLENFQRIILELIDFGISQIEISGGGEPLEHSQAEDLINCMCKIREKAPSIKIGLLTNGLHINEYHPKKLFAVFNEYIRFSRFEKIESSNVKDWLLWRDNIKALLDHKRKNPNIQTKIGIKYLLAPENQDNFVEMVEGDLKDNDISDLDYFRFTSDRRIDNKIAAEIEQQVFYKTKSARLPNASESVSLSLQTFLYPRNHRCWISPLSVVIAPNFDVYMCCNYLYDKKNKGLGNLLNQSFSQIWDSGFHIERRKRIRRENCDRKYYCNCRFAEIQELFERSALTSYIIKNRNSLASR